MKTKQGIFLLVGLLIIVFLLAGCGGEKATPDPNAAKPSNPGGVGKAVSLKGDAANGATIFADNCAQCHGDQGKGGVANEGAEENVPELNPIDPTMVNEDVKVFAMNIDLFIEHGSTPAGTPSRIMQAYGDQGLLTPQQIADVIAYIISLNKK